MNKMENFSDNKQHGVEKTRTNSKFSDVMMIDQSTSDNFFHTTMTNSGLIELRNNVDKHKRRHLKSTQLFPNDREIPNFLEHNDDEDFHNLVGIDSISMRTRSTQTRMSDTENEPRALHAYDFNSPTTMVNGGSCQVSPPTQFNQELMLTRSQLNSVYHNYQRLKTHFCKLHGDYEKLMGIAAELTTSLEKSVRGQPVDIRATLKACNEIYPEIFNQNVRDNDKLKSSATESKIDYLDKNLKISMLSTVPLSAKDLNFKKIKLHLINGNIKTKLLLLQALRWKITLSQPGERDEAIIEYIRSDLLGIHGQIAGDSGKSILPYILIPLDVVVPHPVQQCAARLLNTFASFKCGRNYLAVGPTTLNVVIQCLDSTHAESIDAFTCDMIIATLQKLSLRKHQRLYMISAGMIEWLIYHLKAECHSMGTYRLEYSTALLMNLSLHREAQIRAATIATMLVSTLIGLLSLEHLPALPYVYGALNNFLTNTAINKETEVVGLKSILEYHRNYRTGELRKHLDHILLRYKQHYNHTIEQEMNDDDDREENDVLEDELDEMDPVKVQAGDLFGEGLLATCYSVSPYVLPIDKNKLMNCSSSDISYRTGDEFNAEREEEKFLNDRYLSFHSQRLSPRLTPPQCKSKSQNPMRLNMLVTDSDLDKKSNAKNKEIIHVDEDKLKFTSSKMSHTKNEYFTDTMPVVSLDQLNFKSTPDQYYIKKVINSFNIYQEKDEEYLSIKTKQTKTSDTNSWILWDMNTNETKNFKQSKVLHSKQCLLHGLKNVSESPSYLYGNKKSIESSMTVVNSGVNASSRIINSTVEGAEVAEERMSSIASLDINLNDGSGPEAVGKLTGEEEDAFATKPRILRTPPQSVSPKEHDSSHTKMNE